MRLTRTLAVLITFLVTAQTVQISRLEAQPAGGYRQSCRDISIQGDVLRASCKDRSENLHPAELHNFAQCVGDIFNDNGVLRCSRGAAPPNGSYTGSCEQVFVDGENLRANCRNRGGGLVATILPNFGQCAMDIFNDDGSLGCGRGVPVPPGSYSRSCAQVFVDGNDLRAVCRTIRGNTVANRLPDFRQCTGEIQNVDGTLRCDRGAIPSGDYQRSCEQTVVNGTELRSSCRNQRGDLVRTVLTGFGQCVGDIFNQDGQLRCSKGGPPPSGSYQRSCSMIWRDSETLNAVCPDADGFPKATSLANLSGCRSEVTNSNGHLSCITGTGALPPGDYADSCRDIASSGDRLIAICRTLEFFDRNTTLDNFSACRTVVENIDGFLACARGNGPVPGGSYHGTCHDVVITNTVMKASCRRGDGSYAESSIDTAGCPPSGISNDQGVLKCAGAAPPPTTPPAMPETKAICAGTPIPPGWILFDISDNRDCGPSDHNSLWIIQFALLLPGAELVVCSSAPTPSGWTNTGAFKDVFKCAYTETQVENVKGIRRNR